jgi:hypothetical protein
VVPKLSERPLKICIYVLWAILVFKVCLSFWGFFHSPVSMQDSFNLILFSMRMVWGYVIIGILSVFAYKLIKIRSIQSATGVLYVMTFFVLVGELISNYLFFRFGVYL